MTIVASHRTAVSARTAARAQVVPAASTWDGGALEFGVNAAVRTLGGHPVRQSERCPRARRSSSTSLIVGGLLGATLVAGLLSTAPDASEAGTHVPASLSVEQGTYNGR